MIRYTCDMTGGPLAGRTTTLARTEVPLAVGSLVELSSAVYQVVTLVVESPTSARCTLVLASSDTRVPIPAPQREGLHMDSVERAAHRDNGAAPASRRGSGLLGAYLADEAHRFGRSRLAELVAGVAVEGAFNVEGGWAAVSSGDFGECDELCFSDPNPDAYAVDGPFASSGAPCVCGRSSSNTVAVMAGFGDGLYPVTRWTDHVGRTVGLAAWFAAQTTLGDLRPQVMEATSVRQFPAVLDSWSVVPLGSLESTGALFFSDVGSFTNFVLECDAPAGQFVVVAWVAPEVAQLQDGMSGPRPMMVAAVTGELADAMSDVTRTTDPNLLRDELRAVCADPMQIVVGHLSPQADAAAGLTARLRASRAPSAPVQQQAAAGKEPAPPDDAAPGQRVAPTIYGSWLGDETLWLAFECGFIAAAKGWEEAVWASCQDLETLTPQGPPVLVAAPKGTLGASEARLVAALHSAGRSIVVVSHGAPAASAVGWLPADCTHVVESPPGHSAGDPEVRTAVRSDEASLRPGEGGAGYGYLMFTAGRVAFVRNWTDRVEIVTPAAVDDCTPESVPLVVLAAGTHVTQEHARSLAALNGAGREVVLISGEELDDAVSAWLPGQSLVAPLS